VLDAVRDSGTTLDKLISEVQTYPQKLVNVRVKEKRPLADMPAVQAEIAAAESEFNGSGRVLVRFSGTEPLARVMIEADSMSRVEEWTARIAGAIAQELDGTISH
jgi:phosphoglucosamine mutase